MEADCRRSLSSRPEHPAGPGTGGGDWGPMAVAAPGPLVPPGRSSLPERPPVPHPLHQRQAGGAGPALSEWPPPRHLPLTERWGVRP